MNIMNVNSKIKHKFKTILGVIRNLVLDFILFFVTAYMRKYPIHCNISTGYNTKCTIYHLRKQVKNMFRQTIYNSNYTQKCSKLLQ